MRKFDRRANAVICLAVLSAAPLAYGGNETFKPAPISLAALQNVTIVPNPGASRIVALPLNAPPINGWIARVAMGLTNENNRRDFNGFAVTSTGPASGTTLPLGGSPPWYSLATVDSGANSHILSFTDPLYTDMDNAQMFGDGSIEIAGASGSEFADISDGLGVYAVGLGNATGALDGSISVNITPRGQTNVSILTTQPGSALTNIVGAPMLAQQQAVIRNTAPRSITVGTTTYSSPNVQFQDKNTAFPVGYFKVPLTIVGAPNPSTPQFVLSGEDINNIPDNPLFPTLWGVPEAEVQVTHTEGGTQDKNFLFDSGAQVTVLSEQLAGNIGFHTSGPNPSTPDFYVEVQGVGGTTQQVPGFYLQKLDLSTTGGFIHFTHVPVLVLDLPDPSGTGTLPGVIGTNLFTDRDMVLNLQNNSAWAGITEQWKWNTDANATWNSSTNWTLATVPNGTDMQANFTDAIHADRTVTVSTDVSVGSIAFDNAFRYMINGPGRITMSVAATGDSAQLNVVSGSHTINALMTFASDVIANIQSDSSTLTISSDVIATNKSISKEGPGTLEMKNVRAGGLLVDAGKVLITPNATAAGASKIGSISFGTATLITGKLDLTNNALAVDYTGSSPVPDIRAFLQSGYAGGAWTGPGITSSHAAAIAADSSNTHKTAIGFAEASAIGNPASWFGQSVDGSSLLMRYTFSGDANLDGHVNSGDFTALAQNFNGANRFWRQGDFNFDGTVNALDFNMIATNFGQVMTSEALGALVPEPGTIAIVILPALLLRRRRDAAPRLA